MGQKGDEEEALRLQLERHALARQAQDQALIAWSAWQLAITYYYAMANPQTARQYIQEVLEFTPLSEARRPYEILLHEMEGDWDQAVVLSREKLAHDRKTGEVHAIFLDNAVLADYLSTLGHLEEARVFAAEAAEIAERDIAYVSGPMASVFYTLIKAGDHARVKMLIEKTEHRARSAGSRFGLWIALYGHGVLALEQGELDDAVAKCEEALQYATRSYARARTHQVLGAALAKRGGPGDVDRARVAYGESLAIFEKMERRRVAEQVRVELARLRPG